MSRLSMSLFGPLLRGCGIVAVLVLMASSAAFAIPVPLSLDDLIEQSDVIAHGIVADLDSRREAEGANIYSIVTVDVSQLVLERRAGGTPPAKVTFRIEGGTVGEETVATSISPELQKGDEGVFFLAHDSGEDTLTLVGGQQGFIPIDGGTVMVEGRKQPVREFLDDVARRLP